MASSKIPMQIQYRNSTYFGTFDNYQRSGCGLLILDNSSILLANWKKNIIHGKYIFINDTIRAYGTMLNNKLDGYNIISTNPSNLIEHKQFKKQEKDKAIYGMFRDNKLYGKAVLIDQDNVLVSQFVSNQLKQIIYKKMIKDRQVYDALVEVFPKSMYTLQQFLISFMKDATNDIQQGEQIPRYRPIVTQYGNQKFYGYQQCFNKGRKYGFMLRQNLLLSVGEHFNQNLQGIGRLVSQNGIEDGIFKNGQLRGIGIRYYKQGNKYTVGQHDGRSTLEKGYGFPNREICEIRKEFHLRSIYFYNDIVMLGISGHLNSMMNIIFVQSVKPKKNVSPKFVQEGSKNNNNQSMRSPLQTKFYKYEIDNDLIEDSSPIKDKVSQYKPIDHRANNYFTLTQEEQQYDKKRANQRFSKFHKQQMQQEQEREQQRRQINSRFNDLKEEEMRDTTNSRAKGRNINDNLNRSPARNTKSGVKDTKQFVKQLEEEQKRKRLDLDKIYRQAGLYRKK